jgi:hypothetical protein
MHPDYTQGSPNPLYLLAGGWLGAVLDIRLACRR